MFRGYMYLKDHRLPCLTIISVFDDPFGEFYSQLGITGLGKLVRGIKDAVSCSTKGDLFSWSR